MAAEHRGRAISLVDRYCMALPCSTLCRCVLCTALFSDVRRTPAGRRTEPERESPELQDRPARRRTALFNARRYASAVHAVVMCPSVCPSVGQKPELYPKRLEESSCHGGFLPPVPRCVIKNLGISKLWTWKISTRQFDRVVNETR